MMHSYDYDYIVYCKDGQYYLDPECTILDATPSMILDLKILEDEMLRRVERQLEEG